MTHDVNQEGLVPAVCVMGMNEHFGVRDAEHPVRARQEEDACWDRIGSILGEASSVSHDILGDECGRCVCGCASQCTKIRRQERDQQRSTAHNTEEQEEDSRGIG